MKQKTIFYYLTIAAIFLSNISYGQTKKWHNKHNLHESTKIVEKLNKPTKVWHDGCWVIKRDGSRVWKKGYWHFEEKSFQKKSTFLRKRMMEKNKV